MWREKNADTQNCSVSLIQCPTASVLEKLSKNSHMIVTESSIISIIPINHYFTIVFFGYFPFFFYVTYTFRNNNNPVITGEFILKKSSPHHRVSLYLLDLIKLFKNKNKKKIYKARIYLQKL